MQQMTPQPLSWKTRIGILAPLLAMASLPLFVYFKFEHEYILLHMWLILIVVQFILSIRTAKLAIGMISGIRKRDGKRVQLTLTEAEAKSFPRQVFMEVMRATWIDHVMLAFPRLGVGLAFMQYFHSSPLWQMFQSDILFNARPFLFRSYNPPQHIYPDVFQIIVAWVILMLYCISEVALTISFGVLWGTIARKFKSLNFVIVSRILIIGVVLIGFIIAIEQRTPNYYEPALLRRNLESCEYFDQNQRRVEKCDNLEWKLIVLRTNESIQVGITSFFDQGVLIGSNIMRPEYCSYGNSPLYDIPFIIRNILSAILAFSIYTLLIWLSLRIAQQRLIRHASQT